MLVLKINQDFEDTESILDVVDYLNSVTTDVKDGFKKGVGWELKDDSED